MSFAAALQLVDTWAANPLSHYLHNRPGDRGGAAPFQRDMHAADARKRAIIAANGVGKTWWGAAESWRCLLGNHPRVPSGGCNSGGILGWVLCSDLSEGWPVVSAALHGLAPPGAVDPTCTYDEVTGYVYKQRKALKVSEAFGGGLLIGKGCEQSPLALEGRNIDFGWVDEPPKRVHFNGLRARLRMSKGPLWLTMTPIGRPCGWLRHLIEGDPDDPLHIDPEEPDWHIAHVPLTHANAPHRDRESIEFQVADTDPLERIQRIEAGWEGVAQGRVLVGFNEAILFDADDAWHANLPRGFEVGLGWDHGERQGAEVCYLLLWDGQTLWVLDEYVSPAGAVLPIEHVRAVRDMLARWEVPLHGVDWAVGDTNSAGWKGPGIKVNDELEAAFCRLTGMHRPPFRIEPAKKGRGSVLHRRRLMNNAMMSGRFRIEAGCASLIKTARYWEGKDDDLKHAFDAVMYGASRKLEAFDRPPPPGDRYHRG